MREKSKDKTLCFLSFKPYLPFTVLAIDSVERGQISVRAALKFLAGILAFSSPEELSLSQNWLQNTLING
jgi:hypothetical protein